MIRFVVSAISERKKKKWTLDRSDRFHLIFLQNLSLIESLHVIATIKLREE